MSQWSQVSYIKNIRITVDGGQSSSSIYGNERNCTAVTVSFNGMLDDEHCLDLSTEDVGLHTQLIDFDTGDQLPWEDISSDDQGLFYSYSQGRYCNSPSLTRATSTDNSSYQAKRAQVTYYVRGKCIADMRRIVAVQVVLYNGRKIFTTTEEVGIQRVNILIKSPIRYSASDLEPFKWDSVIDTKSVAQRVAFAKLKREFKTYWIGFKFDVFDTYLEELPLISRTLKEGSSYSFYLCPLGEQKSFRYKSTDTEVKMTYNQEPGAFCVICIRTESKYAGLEPQTTTNEGSFKLYDYYGNMGEFTLNFVDPINPTCVTQNN